MGLRPTDRTEAAPSQRDRNPAASPGSEQPQPVRWRLGLLGYSSGTPTRYPEAYRCPPQPPARYVPQMWTILPSWRPARNRPPRSHPPWWTEGLPQLAASPWPLPRSEVGRRLARRPRVLL